MVWAVSCTGLSIDLYGDPYESTAITANGFASQMCRAGELSYSSFCRMLVGRMLFARLVRKRGLLRATAQM